jgi:cell division septum initiation protein DivIVA
MGSTIAGVYRRLPKGATGREAETGDPKRKIENQESKIEDRKSKIKERSKIEDRIRRSLAVGSAVRTKKTENAGPAARSTKNQIDRIAERIWSAQRTLLA